METEREQVELHNQSLESGRNAMAVDLKTRRAFFLFLFRTYRFRSLQLNGREELTLTVDLQRARAGRGCQLSSLMHVKGTCYLKVCADGSNRKA